MKDWQKHISSTACFHFDASKESLYGIERKFNYLHNRGVKIKNAILLFDPELLAVTTNSQGHVFRKHPLLSGESYFSFQMVFFKDFVDYNFIKAYIYFRLTHKITDESVTKFLFNPYQYHYDEAINEESYPQLEVVIYKNPDSFYMLKKNFFYTRDTVRQWDKQLIKDEQIKLLTHIKSILDEDNTDYRIVINPLYNQKRLDTTDLKYLRNLFSAGKVFDFSGINDMTNSIYNYYDASHYRPAIAARIMDSIYAKH